jgi:hypothetical protein
MAPRRLIPGGRDSLVEDYPKTLRFRIIAKTPTIFIDYLFEILLSVACLLTSVAYFTGFLAQGTILQRLPTYIGYTYAVALALGSLTVMYGLGRLRYGTWMSTGLKLLAIASVCYAIAAIYFVGWRMALVVTLMSLVFAAIAAWRSFLLRSTYILLASQGPSSEKKSEKG